MTADEAFNRALQQQHHRQSSWGSNASSSSANAPAPAAAAAASVTENVPSQRLLATIHSGIPSTDDDGPLFNELHKLAVEDDSESQRGQAQLGQGQLQNAPELFQASSAAERGPQDQHMNLNQVGLAIT